MAWYDIAEPGITYNPVTRLLWHETFFIDEVYDVARYIKERTKPEDRLFGDSTSLPLIALLAERRIIDDFGDTNIMRFKSNVTSAKETIKQIDRPELVYLVPRHQTGFFRVNDFVNWAKEKFILEKQVKERYGGTFMIYRRRPAAQ